MTAQALGRRVSGSLTPARAVAKFPAARAVIEVDEDEFYVRLGDAEAWLQVAPEEKPSATVPAGWDGRVADTSANAKTYLLRWVDADKVPEHRGKEFVVVRHGQLVDAAAGLPVIETAAEERFKPKEGCREIAFEDGGKALTGFVNPKDGTLYLRVKELPAAAATPESLTRLILRVDAAAVRAELAKPAGAIRTKLLPPGK